MSRYDALFAAADSHLQVALTLANGLDGHSLGGTEFEVAARRLVGNCLVGAPCVSYGELATSERSQNKQLDLVVHEPMAPLLTEGGIRFERAAILIAGEVKRNLRDREDILRTAERLDSFAANPDGESRPLPFVVIAGEGEQ